MKNFEIDTENNIRVLDSAPVGPDSAAFQNEQELRKIIAEWPLYRLVEVWNKLPGAKPVAKFKDRKTACARIWKAVQERDATVGAQARDHAPAGVRTRKKAGRGQKRATTRQGAKKASGRQGSKTAKILALLERPDGASLKELMAATGWQAHSVRGFLSGQVGKKMGRKVESSAQEGERHYRIKPSK